MKMKSKKICVFGSFITDLTSNSSRLPLPGETILGTKFKSGPGGKGSNQAVASHRAGAEVSLITKLGNDLFGKAALEFYESEGMSLEGILIDDKYPTGCALIMVGEDTAQNMIVVIPSVCEHFTNEDLVIADKIITRSDYLLTQLETNIEAVDHVLSVAKSNGCLTILNPAPAQPLAKSILKLVDVITPNETEASILTGIDVDDNPNRIRAAAQGLFALGVKNVIITLGSNGVYANDSIEEIFIPAKAPYPVVDTTGAGDAFNGGFVSGLSFGFDFFDAVHFGSVVAGLSVTKFGTAPSMPHKELIFKHYHKSDIDNLKRYSES